MCTSISYHIIMILYILCILVIMFAGSPILVGAWSMVVLLEQRIDYYYLYTYYS